MSNVGLVRALPIAAATTDTDSTEATAEQEQIAKDYPAGFIKVEREGAKIALRVGGALTGVVGAGILGVSLLSGRGGGAGSRLVAGPLIAGGGLAALGLGAAFGAGAVPDKSVLAIATGIPTREKAQDIAAKYPGRDMEVVVDRATGKFAVIDQGPTRTGGPSYGYERGRGHYYGDGHYHGHHYYGDGHHHHPGYYEPWYPGTGDYYPDPYYPTNPGGGYTSPGDDYDYNYPTNPGGGYGSGGTSSGDDYDYSPPSSGGGWGSGGTSSGDDYGSGGSSYDPPSYDPPSYDPPSYDPPSSGGGWGSGGSSYDPPSYDPPSYDPPSYDYGGGNSSGGYDSGGYSGGYDSSSNGNPSYDDF